MTIQPRGHQGINVLKAACCIIVAYMHCRFPGAFGAMISYVLRFPVSIFFMISGYYSVGKSDTWIKRKALYSLKLLLISESCYAVLNALVCAKQDGNFFAYVLDTFSHAKWYKILFSGTLFCGPLWYLYALCWTWALFYLVRMASRENDKVNLLWIPLLAIAILLRHLDLGDPEETVWLFRNGFLYGLPFMLLGSWLRNNEKLFDNKKIALLIAAGFMLIVLEYFIDPVIYDFQLSTVLIAIAIFAFALKFPTCPDFLKPVSYIGSRMSMYVYLSHVAFRSISDAVATSLEIRETNFYNWVRPLIVISVTLVFSYMMAHISSNNSKT